MTSYVFTEDETPLTLREWFVQGNPEAIRAVTTELFDRALRPWYGHSSATTIDLFDEFPIFSGTSVNRMIVDCRRFHGFEIQIGGNTYVDGSLSWVSEVLRYLAGDSVSNVATREIASELQVLRSYRSICHGDLHLDNVLVLGKKGAEYPCVIDFEATHEGYVLKDFGRFIGGALFRTFDWSAAERGILVDQVISFLLEWQDINLTIEDTIALSKFSIAVVCAKRGALRAWQAGSYPGRNELAAALIGSFLPFARYWDTSKDNAQLCLELTSALVGQFQ